MTGSYLEPDESEKEMTGDLKPNYPQILWVQLDGRTSVPQEGAKNLQKSGASLVVLQLVGVPLASESRLPGGYRGYLTTHII